MKDIRKLHRAAMELAKQAKTALAERNAPAFTQLTLQALELEREAAMELTNDFKSEPTRAVLFRSAASMAFNVGKFEDALELTHRALIGKPYLELVDELIVLQSKIERALTAHTSIEKIFEDLYYNLSGMDKAEIPTGSEKPRSTLPPVDTIGETVFSDNDQPSKDSHSFREYINRDWQMIGFQDALINHANYKLEEGIKFIGENLNSYIVEIIKNLSSSLHEKKIAFITAGEHSEKKTIAKLNIELVTEELIFYQDLSTKDFANDRNSEYHHIFISYTTGFIKAQQIIFLKNRDNL